MELEQGAGPEPAGSGNLEFHQKELRLRCRVCGRRLVGKKNAPVDRYTDELLVTHNIDLREDNVDRHPRLLCSGCVTQPRQPTKAKLFNNVIAAPIIDIPIDQVCRQNLMNGPE